MEIWVVWWWYSLLWALYIHLRAWLRAVTVTARINTWSEDQYHAVKRLNVCCKPCSQRCERLSFSHLRHKWNPLRQAENFFEIILNVIWDFNHFNKYSLNSAVYYEVVNHRLSSHVCLQCKLQRKRTQNPEWWVTAHCSDTWKFHLLNIRNSIFSVWKSDVLVMQRVINTQLS